MNTLSIILMVALAIVLYWCFAIILLIANVILGVAGMEPTFLCKVDKN